MNKDSYHSMKRGLALSLVVHVIFLSWGAVQFTSSVSLPQPLEAIPITLAPLVDELSSQQGSVKAPIRAIPAVKPTMQPQEKEDARHIGEGQIDSLAPFQPKEKLRPVETASLPQSENTSETFAPELTKPELLEAKTEDTPKVAPEMPLSAPEDTPKVAPKMPLSTPEDAPKVAPEMPLRAPEDTPKVAPEMPLSAPEDTPKVAPKMLLSAPEDTPKVAPEMPLRAPEDTPKVAPEMPLRAPEDTPKVASEMPLRAPEDTPKVAPEMPLKAPEDALKPAHKNEEMISPKELAPTVQKVPAEQIVHQAPKITLPEKFFLPQFKPKFDEEFPRKNVAALNQKTPKLNKKNQEKQSIEDILALEENNLLNRARSQGGGAKRSHTPEALGARKNIDDTTKMAQTLVNIAGGCIQQKLKLVALGGDLKNRPVVRLRFYLDREGMVMGDPIIDPVSGLESQQAIMIRQVYAAVFSCQPYADLPRDQYDLWGQGFDFNVDPLQEIR
ncbi:cell envelope biogenesis protein TolA [Bartonella grahamii]|uniref:cell envelope biogenesis protein TolA n=1 Tax=Bartonella grahamii TaxID=33045 RepID=UPI001ABAF0B0|nr:cell envelope biogenesis protein TolA [Bartonella grahamii]